MPLEKPDDQEQPSTSGAGEEKEKPKKKISTIPQVVTSHDEDDVPYMSEQQRFYYLRLMAKPGKRPEPIKMKFVRWAPPLEKNLSVDDENTLESQAMRVVRTIGQAFEVCHKMAQEQMQEKQQLEETEANNNLRNRVSGSAISEEDLQQLQALAEEERAERGATERTSEKSPSPVAQPPPPPPAPSSGKRHSIFMPRRFSSDVSSQGTAIDTTAMVSTSATNPLNPAAAYPAEPQPSTSQGLHQANPSMMDFRGNVVANPQNQAFQPGMFPSGSSTLPHSHTWNPGHPTQQMPGTFSSIQSLEAAQNAQASYPFYPFNPMMAPSSSMPYGLSSQAMVSPYATLQLPTHSQAQAGQQQQDMQQPSTSTMPPNPAEMAATALQFNRSLDNYNQQLIRSQLEQAQQAAQVASCQVQLLRDQLTSETTARIEAQSRTHQLLNTNRELLEQVQALVSRLQHLETKLSTDIHMAPTAQPGQLRKLGVQQEPLPTTASSVPHIPSTSGAFQPSTSTAMSYHENLAREVERKYSQQEPPAKAMRPYQIQTLADLRSGSLPPSGEEVREVDSPKKRRRPIDDSGTRTEPETEDTTDYSSSDQYEKTGHKMTEERDDTIPPHYSILLSNPQTLNDLSSFFQPYNVPPAMPQVQQVPQIPPTLPRMMSMTKQPMQAATSMPGSTRIPSMAPTFAQQQQQFMMQQQQVSPPMSQAQQQTTVSVQQQQPIQAQQLIEEEKQEQPGPSEPTSISPKKTKSGLKLGVLKEKEFTRMSFNTRNIMNRTDKRGSITAQTSTANEPEKRSSGLMETIETIPEETREELQRRRSSIPISEPSTSMTSNFQRPIVLPRKFELPSTSKEMNPPAPLLINKLSQGIPASASLATAMYPPVKSGQLVQPNKVLPDKKFRALSVELDKSPLKGSAIPGPSGMSPPEVGGKPPSIPMLSAAIERLSNRPGASTTSANINVMNANPATPPLRYVPERIKADGNANVDPNTTVMMNNNRPEVIRGYIDPDSVRGRTLQALDSQKLSDPSVLARLTRNLQGGKDGNFNLPNGLP